MLQIAHTYAIENVSRRSLLKGLVAGGGLVLMARRLPGTARAAQSSQIYPTNAPNMPHGTINDPHVFISIARDGIITIVAARAEMGTGAARTSLPMIIAEELDANWSRVKVVQSPGDEVTYGNQDTDGSRSVRQQRHTTISTGRGSTYRGRNTVSMKPATSIGHPESTASLGGKRWHPRMCGGLI